MLAVTINLTEMGERDASDPTDVRLFTRRLDAQVPHPPDIVLVQEVRLRSAKTTAAALTKRFGRRFAIGVAPAREPIWERKRRDGTVVEMSQESAVIFNASTMKMTRRPRYVRTSFWDGSKKAVRKHPYSTFREIGSHMKVTVAGVHLFMQKKISSRRRAGHARRVAKAVERQAASAGSSFEVLGGDFNGPMRVDGEPTRFYRTLVSWRKYTDTIQVPGVDYIFARGPGLAVADAGVDRRDKAYSDHAFRWSLFGR